MSFSTDRSHYAGMLLTLVMIPMMLDAPGSGQFFTLKASLWGVGSLCFSKARKRVWESHGMISSPHWIQERKEMAPGWAFDANFYIQLLNLPCALVVMYQILATGMTKAASWSLSDYASTDELWLEHMIFACLFGFMCRDLVLHRRNPDLRFVLHHIFVSILMLSFAFATHIPGIRLLAFCTAVELGSAAYCQWILWRHERLYTWVMHTSNVVMVGGGSVCVYFGDPRTPFMYFLCLIGIGLAVGRTAALWGELFSWHSELDLVASFSKSSTMWEKAFYESPVCGHQGRSRVDSDCSTAASENY